VASPRWRESRVRELRDRFALHDESPVPDPESQAPAVLRMKLVGANPHAKVSGLDELPGKSNYFIGNDPKKWRTNVPNYAKVKYANVYPGVDLVYYGNQGQLEYDFVVRPGADPSSIELAMGSDERPGSRQNAVGRAGLAPAPGLRGQDAHATAGETPALRVDGNGDLVVAPDGGEVTFHKPVVYQPARGDGEMTKDQGQGTKDRHFVDGRYMLAGNRVTFEVANYDKTRPLVIDPVLGARHKSDSRCGRVWKMALSYSVICCRIRT